MRLPLSVIVEGHGDAEAVPVLLRRLAPHIDPSLSVDLQPPIRVGKTKLLRSGEIERVVELAARKLRGRGAILILMDADDDCPGEQGPEILARARRARPDIPIRTVLANKEFEAWFLAAAKSLRGQRGLPEELDPPAVPEEIRGAKEWLSSRMHHRHYRETIDQPAMASLFDLDEAEHAQSFRYLVEKLRELVREQTERPASA